MESLFSVLNLNFISKDADANLFPPTAEFFKKL